MSSASTGRVPVFLCSYVRGSLSLSLFPFYHLLFGSGPRWSRLVSPHTRVVTRQRVIAMTQTTQKPQEGRHHALISSRIHPQNLLLRPSVLRALLVRQTGSRITLDINTKRIEPARFDPLRRLWPDATSVTRWCFVLRQLY